MVKGNVNRRLQIAGASNLAHVITRFVKRAFTFADGILFITTNLAIGHSPCIQGGAQKIPFWKMWYERV